MRPTLSARNTLGGLQLTTLAALICFQAVRAAPTSSNDPFRRNDTQPSLNEYLEKRAELIAEERAIRFDAGVIGNATSKELRAIEIVDTLRLRKQQSVWYADRNKEPGMPFLWAKDTIGKAWFLIGLLNAAQTELFKLIKKMPKGALLHAHSDAIVDAKYLLQLTLNCSRIHLRTASGVNSTVPLPTPTFRPLSQAEANQYANNSFPTSPDYPPNSWVSAQRFREGFPIELGGKDGFDKWIIGAMTISADDTYVQYNTTAKIWEKFTNTFLVALASIHSTLISEDGTRNLTNSEVLNITQSIIDEVKARLQGQGRGDEFIGARIIYSATRSISAPEMIKQLGDCLELKAKYPELIAGFDMAGQEDPGHPLVFFAEALLDFRSKAEKRGLDIPFMFHAGETLDDGGEVDSNLYDAFLLGAKRIGHGFSLAKHPLLMQKYRENGIVVEVCPISNELLCLNRSANTHILPVLLNNGVPVVLSSDDPAVFQNPGLSFDFYQAMVASNMTNILSLGKLARQSLEYSSLNGTTKETALKLWDTRWNGFIDEIVALN